MVWSDRAWKNNGMYCLTTRPKPEIVIYPLSILKKAIAN